jgi:hypothetical protein
MGVPSMNKRLAAIAVGGSALSLMLGGCLKMELSVDIKSEENIAVVSMVGVERSAAESMGETGGDAITPESLCASLETSNAAMPEDYSVKDVSDDEYVACEAKGTTTLADMDDSLSHADGVYTFEMAGSGGAGEFDDMEIFEVDSLEVSVTFPGKVLEHNGSSTVSGRTVTWTDPDDLYSADGSPGRECLLGCVPARQRSSFRAVWRNPYLSSCCETGLGRRVLFRPLIG